jgi:hypothetical protein
MPIETDTSTTSSGGTTTVGATVRDGGPGGTMRTVDVYLHIQPSKFVQVSAPATAHMVDANRLSVWWKDQALPAGGTINFSYDIRPRDSSDCSASTGEEFEGSTEGTLVVCDRGANKLFLVRRFCVCGSAGEQTLVTSAPAWAFNFSGLNSPKLFPKGKKKKRVQRKPGAGRSGGRRKSGPRG